MEKYLDFRENIDYEKLKEPAEILKNGGIIIFPTETVYGIGANALDENAVKRIYDVKRRDLNKPISVLVSDFDMIDKIAKNITDIEYKIMKTFFPGPLTIILKKKEIVPNIVTAGLDYVGVRMPEGEIARKLVELTGVPLATPSANISGSPSGTNLDTIMKDFEGKVDLYIDGGESKLGLASTIVKVVDGEIKILREGSITKEEIKEKINRIKK